MTADQDASSWDRATAGWRADVDRALADHGRHVAAELRAQDSALDPLADELVRWVTAGGKRLRPLLVLVGHVVAGGRPADVLGAACALELVHTWALVHDDLIDASATRRGHPTTHELFAALHRSAGHDGDPDAWGGAMAILLGDLFASMADDAFATTAVSHDAAREGRAVFGLLRREVMAGQVLDVTVAADGRVTVPRALHVATLKSGRYTVTRPLELGATLGGAGEDDLATLRRAGDALGVAFQLRDDLLGLWGDHDRTGKPVGDDLREGKRTVVIAEGLARLDEPSRDALRAVLGDRGASRQAVAATIAMLDECGAHAAVEARIEDLLATGIAAVEALPASDGRDRLMALAAMLADRRA